jgi:DNA-binding CsgD family transcriptional regulator
MEFNVANAPYYHLHMDKSQKSESLSNRFYWSEAFIFPETSEKIMMCSVPLIDTEGNVFGVCGFDVSYMLFKMSNMPDSNMYNRIFCLFAPVENNVLKMDGSLFSGGYFARSLINNQDLKIASGKKSLYVYENDESSFIGYHRLLKLYPEKSLFVDREWALALMVPQDDINSFVVKTNLKLIYISTILMIIGIIIAFILSKYYIIPIARGIDIIKNNPKARIKTNVLEIDELIEFLLNKGTSSEKEIDPNSIILNDFLKNIRSLSPAERSVFNLYAQQYNAKEISENLYLSINTIKTHTKHIYSKLNITSKEELILYVEILKETGRDIK